MHWFQVFRVVGLLALAPAVAFAGEEVVDQTPDPEPIIGGQTVPSCGFPGVVRLGGCTGTLVHPRVVVYAAHCGRPGSVTFGDNANGSFSVGASCQTNPTYSQTNDQGDDWAVCTLNQEVTDIPPTPIMFGCEMDRLEAGLAVTLCGFGDSAMGSGYGIKRYVDTFVNSVTEFEIGVGGQGMAACEGDSGGPMLVQMEDGSWRTTGITSTRGVQCGSDNTYARTDKALPWFEQVTGVDLTPCHDPDGTWNPGPECTGFFAGGPEGHGSWSNSCSGTPTSGPSDTCGDPFGAGDDDPPTVSITAPADGDNFMPAPADIDVTVDADDGTGSGVVKVTLEIDGAEITDDTAEPWAFDAVNFPAGTYDLVAVAEDGAGNTARSEAVSITVGDDAPDTGDDGDDGSDDGGDDGGDGGTGGADDGGDGGTGGADGGGDDGGSADGGGEKDGCGCTSTPTPAPAVATLMLLALVRRRR